MRPAPRTASVLALGAAALLLAVGCGGGDDGGARATTTSTTVEPGSVESATQAADVALRTMPAAVPAADVRTMVLDLCAAATSGSHGTILQDLQGLGLPGDDVLAGVITALGTGAEAYCPDGVARAPALLRELYAALASSAGLSPTPPAGGAGVLGQTPPSTLGGAGGLPPSIPDVPG